MSARTIQQRVAHLEARVAELQEEVRAARLSAKDWRRTIGAFTDDAGMQAILQEAMRLREADRQKARPKKVGQRKSSR
ncbi:MAG: hypothetical protein L0211_24895 [Planctomycetaceae bacterium]|nr:hypothetical protein [Planctomycetaceae bacterium]